MHDEYDQCERLRRNCRRFVGEGGGDEAAPRGWAAPRAAGRPGSYQGAIFFCRVANFNALGTIED